MDWWSSCKDHKSIGERVASCGRTLTVHTMPTNKIKRPPNLDTATEQRKIAAATELAHNDDLLAHLFLDTLLIRPDHSSKTIREKDAIGTLIQGERLGVHYQQPEYENKQLEHDPTEILKLLQEVSSNVQVCMCMLPLSMYLLSRPRRYVKSKRKNAGQDA